MITTMPTLQELASFLRRHHVRELAEENLRLLVELDAPLLKSFSHLSAEELLALSIAGLDRFLLDLEEGRALETAAENLRQFEEGRLEGITTENVVASDMVLVSAAQKQALLRFVDRFTSDLATGMAVVREIETFYTTTQTEAFKVFTRLREAAAQRLARAEAEREAALAQAEELQALNEELTAQTEELQQQAEELLAGQEELARLNDALRARNEQIEEQVTERTRELRAREAILSNAQVLGNFGSWEWNPASNTLAWSDQLYRIYGLEPGETPLSFETFFERLHPDDRAAIKETIERAVEAGSTFAFTERIIRPDGAQRILESTGEVITDAKGRPTIVRGVCQDVTERKQLDEQLHAANEELQAANEELQSANEELYEQTNTLIEQRSFLTGIFDNIPGGIATLDTAMVFQSVNPTYAAAFQRRPEEFAGRPLNEVFPGAVAHVEAILSEVIETGEAFSAYGFPFTYTDAQGTHDTYWDFTYAPLKGPRGAVTGILALAFEVTPRVRLEREMAEQQALTERIVENAPAGIAFLDSDLVYRRLNPAYAHLLGMTIDQVLDRRIDEVFPGATAEVEVLMREVMRTGVPHQATDFPFRFTLNGEEKLTYWDFTYQPVLDEHGKVGILILEVEVSDRQERERLKNEQIDQLQELDRYKDQFLSVISHELRTPLNFITGFASTLEDEVQGPLNDKQHEAIGKILNGADRMLYLVDDLLDFAKIQSGRFDLSPEPTRYPDLVDEVLGLLKPLADQKQLAIEVDVQLDRPIHMDPARISQVLTNLVNNAIKFTDAGGSVCVRAYARGEELVTEIKDTGCGIADEHRPKLFHRFQQLDMSNTRKAGGTGLGLAISKAMVEAHEGAIGVESEPGVGSTFWFTLPLR